MNELKQPELRIAVDIGGTFTDGVATLSNQGRIWVGKTLTTPHDPGEAVSTVISDLLRQVDESYQSNTPALGEVVHGTTLVTNTLIERKGVRTALVTTKGMKDALDVRREQRYDLYDLELQLPDPLVTPDWRIELAERMDSAGNTVQVPSEEELARVAEEVKRLGARTVAVCFINAYVNGSHERQVAEYLRDVLPGVEVSTSSELASEIKEFERFSTTTANAYVKPIVAEYLLKLQSRIDHVKNGTPLRVMLSSGGFAASKSAAHSPIFLLESGPAAGVLSAINTAASHDVNNVLAFDMGGTTAKACVVVDCEAPVGFSFECARVHRFKRGSGLPILIPSIDLIEIGAGGGSIAHVSRLGLLNVGPESAASVPGPACYGLGGNDPTVTDADLLLGYLNPANFLGGEMSLRKDHALAAMARVASKLKLDPLDVAWGIYNMVNENMASAARVHIAEKGHDPRSFTMIATGGAGPVHAAEVARKLRIPRLLVSVGAGAGSCLGMLAAPARADRAVGRPSLLAEVNWSEVRAQLETLREDALSELVAAGAKSSDIGWELGAEMRYEGQDDNVVVRLPYEKLAADVEQALREEFETQYRRLYGHLVPGAQPQVLTWRLTGQTAGETRSFFKGDATNNDAAPTKRDIYLPLKRAFGQADVYRRYSLTPGTRLQGPLVLEERESTIVVPFDADVEILADSTVSITLREFE